MSKTPIHQVLRDIKRLTPFLQACTLRGYISSEPKRSVRRQEFESALKALMNRQLKRENRAA